MVRVCTQFFSLNSLTVCHILDILTNFKIMNTDVVRVIGSGSSYKMSSNRQTRNVYSFDRMTWMKSEDWEKGLAVGWRKIWKCYTIYIHTHTHTHTHTHEVFLLLYRTF